MEISLYSKCQILFIKIFKDVNKFEYSIFYFTNMGFWGFEKLNNYFHHYFRNLKMKASLTILYFNSFKHGLKEIKKVFSNLNRIFLWMFNLIKHLTIDYFFTNHLFFKTNNLTALIDFLIHSKILLCFRLCNCSYES